MSFNGELSSREINSCCCRESHQMELGREAACSRSPCAAGRRVRLLRRGRPRLWSQWRASFPVLLVVVLSLGGLAVSAMETTECLYETTLDELGGGSHEVSVDVFHTFDGVPAADQNCPQGEWCIVQASKGRARYRPTPHCSRRGSSTRRRYTLCRGASCPRSSQRGLLSNPQAL